MLKKILFKNINSLIFDCDGVILNSNDIKSNAFKKIALNFGKKKSDEFLKYHLENVGLSRYKKFEYFFHKILNKDYSNDDMKNILNEFSNYVFTKLCNSEVTSGLDFLKRKTFDKKWFIVTGGDEVEVKRVFKFKKINYLFDNNIYGSPPSKSEIFNKLFSSNKLKNPSIYFGDSINDYEVANMYNLDFIFVSKWTKLDNWKKFCESKNIYFLNEINDLNYYF